VKINSFLTACILSLPLAVSLSGAAAAQAACPCFTAAVVNPTTCDGSLRTIAMPDHAQMLTFCDLNLLPIEEIEALNNDPEDRFFAALHGGGVNNYATSIGGNLWMCTRPGETKRITVQQWHSCNQILIDASK